MWDYQEPSWRFALGKWLWLGFTKPYGFLVRTYVHTYIDSLMGVACVAEPTATRIVPG